MGNRVVYGHSFSSNGWPMVDEGSCTWAAIPGTSPPVTIEIQNGQPLQIIRAFVADINAYVEQVRDGDTACWTATNSVDTSNHLSGTAVDIDWNSHPFRVPDAGWTPEEIATIREILDFYEGTVFWGNDWTDPKDAMHFQLASLANGGDINTYGNPDVQKFIGAKIRADGFSTFRRGGSGGHLPLSKKDGYALAIINEGKRLGITPKGITIALATPLVETNLTMYANRNAPASLNLPHDAVGVDHDSTGLYQQRQAWGPLSETMDPTLSARLFFNGGQAGQRGLTDFPYNTDARTPGGWCQAVQVSAFPDRYDQRMGEAQDIYNRLANIAPADPTDEFEELMALTVKSASIYAPPNENPILVSDLIRSLDAHGPHEPYVEAQARAGDSDALFRVVRTAAGGGQYGNASGPVNQAKAVLADIEKNNPDLLKSFLATKGA